MFPRRLQFHLGFVLALATVAQAQPLSSAPDLHNYGELTLALKGLQQNHTEHALLTELATSLEERGVWLLEMGAKDPETRSRNPGVLLVGGLEGDELAGTEILLALASKLVQESTGQALLDSTTVYIVPRLNPDAAERYFLSPKMDMAWNTSPFDDDHDGFTDEDGPQDLDGDGFITSLRVEDPEGTYMAHPQENRIPVQADAQKSEQGLWKRLTEGVDDDGDESVNEDGLGGVNFNKNFPFEYPWFDVHAGLNSVGDPVTRALAQFVVDHRNIAIVFTYSRFDTLYKAPDSGEASSGREPQKKIRTEDAKWYEQIGKQFREKLSLDKTLDLSKDANGTFAGWMYFHRGRLALSAPVWSPDIAMALKDSLLKEEVAGETQEATDTKEDSDNEEKKDGEEKKEEKKDEAEKDKRAEAERGYLKWLDENAPDYFVAWQAVEHPDYPGQKVEVGGWAPYAQTLPPGKAFEKITNSHVGFLLELAGKVPRVHIQNVEVKPLGKGVFDVTVRVENLGYLPTVLEHGERTGEVRSTRIEIDLPDTAFLSGQRMTKIATLTGSGGDSETRFVIYAPGQEELNVQVISEVAGRDERTVSLAGGNE